jgi:long-chain fatty acid transport protein
MSHRGWKAAIGVAGLVLSVGAAMPAKATNGYFSSGTSVESKGMAGLGVALGSGALAAAANPALAVGEGTVVGGGIDFFMPDRTTTVGTTASPEASSALTPGTFSGNGESIFFVPAMGYNYMLDDKSSVGVMLYANGGMNTHYNTNPFRNFGQNLGTATASDPLRFDLQQVFIQANYARKLGHGVTLGVGPVFAIQRFADKGFEPFKSFSTDPSHVTSQGYDNSYGGGFKIGGLWDINKWVTAGVDYTSEMYMTKFNKYRGLFADRGSFNIPPSVSEGLTFHVLSNLSIGVEHEHIFNTAIKSLSAWGGQNGSSQQFNLGASNGAGFGWKDIDIYRIGIEYAPTMISGLTLRTGYSHGTDFQNGDNNMFNIVAPATEKDHVSVGGTYDITKNWGVSLAYQHAFAQSITGNNKITMNPLIPGFDNFTDQSIKLNMDQNEVALGVHYKW